MVRFPEGTLRWEEELRDLKKGGGYPGGREGNAVRFVSACGVRPLSLSPVCPPVLAYDHKMMRYSAL